MESFFHLTGKLLLLALLFALLPSCNKVDAYLNALPDDFQFAAKISAETMFEQASLSGNSQFKSFKKDLLAEMTDEIESSSLRNQIKNIMSDASASGLDFSKPVVMAADVAGEKFVLVMAVKDLDKVQKTFSLIEEEIGNSKDFKINKSSKGTYVGGSEYEGFAIGFNSRSFVAVVQEDYNSFSDSEEMAESLLEQKSLAKDVKSFKQFLNNEDEVGAWFDCDAFFTSIGRNLSRSERQVLESITSDGDFTDCYLTTGLSFEKGKMVMNVTGSFSKEMNKRIRDLYVSSDKSLYKYLPKNAFAICNVNLKNLVNSINEMPSELRDEFKDALSQSDLSMSDLEGMGPAVFAITLDKYADDPEFVLAMKVERNFYRSIREILEYEFGSDAELSYDDGVMLFATNSLASKCKRGGFSDNFSNSRFASDIADGGFVFDFTKVGSLFYDEFGSIVGTQLDKNLAAAVVRPTLGGVEITVESKKPDENILKTTSDVLLKLFN